MGMKAGVMARTAVVVVLIGSLWSGDSGAAPRRAAFQSIANLVAHWSFDETTGTTAADSAGVDNSGMHVGGVTISTTVSPQPSAGNLRSVLLDGTTGSVDVTNIAGLAFTGPFTLSAWVRLTSTPDHQMGVIEFFDSPGTGFPNGYFLRLGKVGNVATAHHLKFIVGDGAAEYEATESFSIPLNTWTHVAGVFDGTFIEIYRDGVSRDSVPAAAPGASSSYLTLGGGTPNVLAGHIDEARIYNRALSATEIGVLFSGQPPPTGLTATAGAAQIALSWTAAVGATNYNVYRSLSAGGPWTLLTSTATTGYTDTTVANPTTYWYQVTAISLVASAPAGPVSATPLPTLPKTTTSGSNNNLAHRCGCDSIAEPAGLAALWGAALLALAGGLLRKR